MHRVYRPMLGLRLSTLACIAALIGFSISFLVPDPNDPTRLVASTLAVGGSLFMFRVARARLAVDVDGFHVHNYLGTRVLSWDETDRFDVGFAYNGISLVTRGGKSITVNAIQKSNIYSLVNRRARADRIVDELNELLVQHRARSLPPVPPLP